MKLIRVTPNEIGAYPPIQELSGTYVPDGMAVWPDEQSTDVFYVYNGFVTLDIQNGVVCGCVPNTDAWEAWKAGQTETEPLPESEPSEADDMAALLVDHEYRLTLLELGLMDDGGEE